MSKQPTMAESTDTVHSSTAAAAAAAADDDDGDADSSLILVDSKVDASEPVGQLHEPVIGLSLLVRLVCMVLSLMVVARRHYCVQSRKTVLPPHLSLRGRSGIETRRSRATRNICGSTHRFIIWDSRELGRLN